MVPPSTACRACDIDIDIGGIAVRVELVPYLVALQDSWCKTRIPRWDGSRRRGR